MLSRFDQDRMGSAPQQDLSTPECQLLPQTPKAYSGRIQERLEEAYRDLISAPPYEIADVKLRRTFAGIKDDLTFDEPVSREGRLKATLRNLNNEDASMIASRILEVYLRLRDQWD
jgi:hypothetical protein